MTITSLSFSFVFSLFSFFLLFSFVGVGRSTPTLEMEGGLIVFISGMAGAVNAGGAMATTGEETRILLEGGLGEINSGPLLLKKSKHFENRKDLKIKVINSDPKMKN